MKRIILTVVGLPGSGKSLTAGMLAKMGFEVIEFGDIWRELLKKNGIPLSDPRATREFTRKLREREGKDVYARYAYKKIEKRRNKVALMGIRSDYETKYIKKRVHKLYIIGLLAPMHLRFERLKKRGKPEDPRKLVDFKWLDTREKRGFMKAKKEEKHGVMTLLNEADFIVANTGTIHQLENNMKKTVEEIKKLNSKK